jgi:hypothetical protein
MFCSRFTAKGEVSLGGAHVAGRLDFTGATLTNPSGLALDANGLVVGCMMLCSDGFSSTGLVSLRGAHIARSLTFSGARLRSVQSGQYALFADSLTVDQDLLCDGLTADGGTCWAVTFTDWSVLRARPSTTAGDVLCYRMG